MTKAKGTSPAPDVPKRSELPAEAKWRLEDIYAANEKWEEDFVELRALLPEIQAYQGKLTASAKSLLECLRLHDRIAGTLERLFCYARMRRDEDNAVALYQAMADRATALTSEVAAATAFITPEILATEPETIQNMVATEPGLALYSHLLDDILRQRPHVLTAEMEQLLAQARDMADGPETIFSMLAHADLKFPNVRDEEGNEVPLSEGRFLRLLESKDRRVRREAFETLFRTYGKFVNTWAAIYSASVKKDIFYARAHKFSSSLEASLHDDNVPVSVYRNLIDTVHANLPLLHRYLEVRKRRLGLDDLHMYDLYTPIVAEADRKVPFEEAVAEIETALELMGQAYAGALKEGFRNRWIDVYENQGKTSGAYSWGPYGCHPFVLLNYQDNVRDLFTVAHEMGHSIHTYFSCGSQPYVYARYPIFLAEVASTCSENLLMHRLLSRTKETKERLYLLNHHLETFRTIVYRQTMFAEFEMLAHEKAEAGEALTPELLSGLYRELNLKYYGAVVNVDEEISLEWARIPHFYRTFYVYKYATGYSAATAISQELIREGRPAVARYLDFLKAGGSDYPIEILKRAGVDMTTPKPVEKALGLFGKLVEEFDTAAT